MFCGFYVLSEEGRMGAINAIIKQGLMPAEEDTTEITVPVYDLINPVCTQVQRAEQTEEAVETTIKDTLVLPMPVHRSKIKVPKYQMWWK